MGLTTEQFEVLTRPLNSSRVAKRSQGGRELSYLESWDVRAHLIRMFGLTNFDLELLDYGLVAERPYAKDGKDMIEVIYRARVRLTVRDPDGNRMCRYTEGACGSESGPINMLGEHHDNALKTAESDALKRCCINLGNQFGLSLYDRGSTGDVIRKMVVRPAGSVTELTDEQRANLEHSLGATEVAAT